MALIIPIRSGVPHQLFEVELDGSTYTLEVRWNERASGYFLNISEAEGTRLLSGIRLVIDWPLLLRWRDERLPAGQFLLVDTSGKKQEPGLAELGARVQLLYVTAAEVREFAA